MRPPMTTSAPRAGPAGLGWGDERQRLLAALARSGEAAMARALARGELRQARILEHAVSQAVNHGNLTFLKQLRLLRHWPVTIDEFVTSREFFGERVEVWDSLWPDLRVMNPDIFVGQAPIYETLLGGATSTGKTTLSSITTAYQLYLFTCFVQAQRLYDLQASTPIVFMIMSVSSHVGRRVIYEPLRQDFLSMPYAQRWVSYNKYKDSTFDLEGGLTVVPALASLQSMIGQAIAGGIVDEVNFMELVESSKQVAGPRGEGGRYDQAEIVYRNLSRRRKGRFTTRGLSLGSLCVLSSTRYKDDFLDRRMDEAEAYQERNIVCFRRKQYEVQPPGRYCGDRFDLLVGTDRYPTRVLPPDHVVGRDYPEGASVLQVPVEYRVDFLRDPEGALRDVCGIASDAITPWITQRHKIIEAVERGRARGLVPFLDCQDVDYAVQGLPQVVPELLPDDEDRQGARRWIHVDLSLSQDRAGVAMIKHTGWVQLPVGYSVAHGAEPTDRTGEGVLEHLPTFAVEMSLSIKPSALRQLDIGELRTWLMQLATYWRFNVYAVTFDGFNSADSIQILRKAGLRSFVISVDRELDPYEYLRRALYQDRLDLVDHAMVVTELVGLEFNATRRKVDHRPRGSKDVCDAIGGAIYAASRSRVLRAGPEYRDAGGVRLRVVGATPAEERLGQLGQTSEPQRRRADPWGRPLFDLLEGRDPGR